MKAIGSNLQDGDSFLKEPLKKGLLVHIAMQGPTAGAQQSVYLAEIEACCRNSMEFLINQLDYLP